MARTAMRRGVVRKKKKSKDEKVPAPEEPKCEMDLVEEKLSRTLELLSKRNRTMIYWSKKRKVWDTWRDLAKKQRRFSTKIARILERSLYDIGF